MSLLTQYGWDCFHHENYAITGDQHEVCGRVISIKGFKHTVIAEGGELECELSGKLLFSCEQAELPRVGDWISFLDYGDQGIITSVLPRKNVLCRKKPGNNSERQVLATNIDAALIVQAADETFNLMRLERYIVQVTACGIKPIIVVNKADLSNDKSEIEGKIASLSRELPVIFCSTVTGWGLPQLCGLLAPGCTYILVGSSGVGKSSLLNVLLQQEVRQTATISESNRKGRHTTTSRDLFILPNGSLVIDSPGMREFGATDEADSQDTLFPAINTLAGRCRYGDCLHIDEPGCAVLEALQSGDIGDAVYASYVKLMKEQKRFQICAEDKKRSNRRFGKMAREATAHRKRNKF